MTWKQRLRITSKLRVEWYETMAQMCADGFAVADSLADMQAEFSKINHPMLPVVRELLLRLRGSGTGRKFTGNSSAQSRTLGTELNGLVPTNEALLIESGERAGNLELGLRQAAEYVTAKNQLGSEVKTALLGPAQLLMILLGILIGFSIYIFPNLEGISPRSRWPAMARRYAALADSAIPLTLLIVVGGVLLALGYMWLIKNWKGSTRDKFDKYLWPFTTTARLNSAAMLASLSGFVNAGVPFSKAIDYLAGSSDPYMADVYARLAIDLRKGSRPAVALINCHIMPESFHWKIAQYGKSSAFDRALASMSRTFIQHAIVNTKAIFSIISFLFKLMIVGFAAWTMASMFGIFGSVKGGRYSELDNLFVNPISVSISIKGTSNVQNS